MKCTKCNSEIQPGAAFCSCCGAAIEKQEPIKKVSMKCEQCNGTLTVDSDKTVLACPYCGHKSLIIENDAVTIERIKTSAHKEIEMEKIKSKDRIHQMRFEKEAKKEEIAEAESFKKGKWAKFLVIAFIISAIITYFYFSTDRTLAAFFSLVQSGCFGIAWCMGMNIIKEKKKYIHILIAVIGIILIVPTMRSCGSTVGGDIFEKDARKIDWAILEMGEVIPEIKAKRIYIYSNDDKWLDLYVYDMSENDCYAYVKTCEQDYGFDIDVKKVGSSFWAYNEKGYKLEILHLGDHVSIDLNCPTEFGEYEIPDYAIEQGLPMPKSDLGHYEWKYDDNFNIRIGNTTFEEYREYVELCIEAGFMEDSQDGNEFYNGDNKKGYELSVNYLGYNIMSIDFDSPEDVESSDSNIKSEPTKEMESIEESEAIKEVETIEEPKPTKEMKVAKEPESTQEDNSIKESEPTKEVEIIKEQEPIIEQETSLTSLLEYEKAFIRKMSNYSLFMMFDEDTKKVVYYGTNDTSIMEGSYNGSFSSGVTISWDDGWDEKFTHSGGNTATLIDGNGFDWEFAVCNVDDAQEVLNDLK